MARVTADPAALTRAVTEDEIAHYREHGWVKLPAFIAPDLVRRMLDIARARMGDNADENALYGLDQPYFNPEPGDGLQDPDLRPLLEQLGSAGRRLLGRAGIGMRYYTDVFAPKLPQSPDGSGTGRGPTAFHQDFITHAIDRSGGMTFWIPLHDCTPEQGTMSFVNGSHRAGVVGSYRSYGEKDVRDLFPELRELGCSAPLDYVLGDISVHDILTVHGAGPNLTDRPRWAYLLVLHPQDACWNGAQPEAFDPAGMVLNQRLDDARFPVLGG